MNDYYSNIKYDYFQYTTLYSCCDKKEIGNFVNRISQYDAEIVKSFNDQLYTQWVVRSYLASKMILAATVMLTSEEYGETNNLKIVKPYLLYYALLSCARAVVFTDSYEECRHDFLSMSHSKIINVVSDIVGKINNKIGADLKKFFDVMRVCRELYSYRFPANGLTEQLPSQNETIQYCKLLCEVAQLQSAAMERAVNKNLNDKLNLDNEILSIGYVYGDSDFKLFDSEDWYRIDYIKRKGLPPLSIINTMTEGLVEDFFGAWCADDECDDSNQYNPDDNWRVIFPVP